MSGAALSQSRVAFCLLCRHHQIAAFGKISSSGKFLSRGVKTSTKLPKDDDHPVSRRAAANFDVLGSWNSRMNLAVNTDESILSGHLVPTIDIASIGAASVLGRRKVNEDRYKCVELWPHILMLAVFDGHGGPEAVDFTSAHMEDHLRFWLERGEVNLTKILHQSFVELNNSFTRHLYRNYIGKDSVISSGTTATVALLRNGLELVVGHVGDTRALLCREGRPIRLSVNHKCDNPAEAKRIKSRGGKVTCGSTGRSRVNGRLDMTRSLGDVDLKQYGVIPDPLVRSIRVRHTRDAFLLLVTDGVTHSLTDQELMDVVCPRDNPGEAAQFICDQALQYGSEDNATAVVVPFGAWGRYETQESTVRFAFGKNIIGRRYS